MNPYYSHAGITIYHGDCREILPTLTADVLVTDPPYGTKHYATDNAHGVWEALAEIVRASTPAAIFGWPEMLVARCVEFRLVPTEWITWWPTNGAARGMNPGGILRESEHIAIWGGVGWGDLRTARGKDSRRIGLKGYESVIPTGREGIPNMVSVDERHIGDVWTEASPGVGFNSHKRQHPNEKPLPVVARLVQGLGGDGLILDPFMGSGTTLRAAKDLGRRAIGIEIEEKYAEIAAKRMEQEVLWPGAIKETE